MGGAGPIQSRADFDRYPWDELTARYWAVAEPKFQALARHLPRGMRALGGVGNGVFEISEDLVGFQYLPYIMVDDPELFAAIYQKIGDLMVEYLDRLPAAPWRCLCHLPLRRRPGLQDKHAGLARPDPPGRASRSTSG